MPLSECELSNASRSVSLHQLILTSCTSSNSSPPAATSTPHHVEVQKIAHTNSYYWMDKGPLEAGSPPQTLPNASESRPGLEPGDLYIYVPTKGPMTRRVWLRNGQHAWVPLEYGTDIAVQHPGKADWWLTFSPTARPQWVRGRTLRARQLTNGSEHGSVDGM